MPAPTFTKNRRGLWNVNSPGSTSSQNWNANNNALMNGNNTVWLYGHVVAGSGTYADPWTGWEQTTYSGNTRYVFAEGWWGTASIINLNANNTILEGGYQSGIKYTGSDTSAAVINQDGVNSVDDNVQFQTYNQEIKNLYVDGGGVAKYCIFNRSAHNTLYDNLHIYAATDTGIALYGPSYVEMHRINSWDVDLNNIFVPVCSPLKVIKITGRWGAQGSTGSTGTDQDSINWASTQVLIIFPRISTYNRLTASKDVNSIGLHIEYSNTVSVHGGNIENTGTAVYIDSTPPGNQFIGLTDVDMEASSFPSGPGNSSTRAIYCDGWGVDITRCICIADVHFGPNSRICRLENTWINYLVNDGLWLTDLSNHTIGAGYYSGSGTRLMHFTFGVDAGLMIAGINE